MPLAIVDRLVVSDPELGRTSQSNPPRDLCAKRRAIARGRHHGSGPGQRQDRHRPDLGHVRDDKPFGGPEPPGAVFYYSRDRAGEHPQAHLANYSGIFQADAYGGYGKLYDPGRNAGPILEAACWVHPRRPFFVMADLAENARRIAGPSTQYKFLRSCFTTARQRGLAVAADWPT